MIFYFVVYHIFASLPIPQKGEENKNLYIQVKPVSRSHPYK